MEVLTLDLPIVAAIALLVPVIALRIARQKQAGRLRALSPFKRYETPALTALKKCPGCAEELPLSALICDGCDYNFLAGSVRYRHKMLPPPEPEAQPQPPHTLAYQATSQ